MNGQGNVCSEGNRVKIWDSNYAQTGVKEKLRVLNARFPWLKLVLVLVLVVLVVFCAEEGLRHGTGYSGSSDIAGEDGSGEQHSLPEVEKEKLAIKHGKKTGEEIPVLPEEQYKGRKLIALTFDDGPSAATTPRLLQILQEKGVRVTFFVVGTMASKSPDLLKQEVAAGHEVGSHTMTHANLPKIGVAGIQSETTGMDELFLQVLGRKPAIMRPPYGSVNNVVRGNVPQPMILWTIDPEDWKYRDAAAVRTKVIGAAFDGAIVLMHDIHASTVDAVAGIIDDLRVQGYEFVTVSELARLRGVTMSSGVAYGSFRP